MDAEQDMQLQVDVILNLMDQCGVTTPFLTKNNTIEVAYDCMIYQVVHKRLAEMKQLREGLNALGLPCSHSLISWIVNVRSQRNYSTVLMRLL